MQFSIESNTEAESVGLTFTQETADGTTQTVDYAMTPDEAEVLGTALQAHAYLASGGATAR